MHRLVAVSRIGVGMHGLVAVSRIGGSITDWCRYTRNDVSIHASPVELRVVLSAIENGYTISKTILTIGRAIKAIVKYFQHV
jgi:hypothetical protein